MYLFVHLLARLTQTRLSSTFVHPDKVYPTILPFQFRTVIGSVLTHRHPHFLCLHFQALGININAFPHLEFKMPKGQTFAGPVVLVLGMFSL